MATSTKKTSKSPNARLVPNEYPMPAGGYEQETFPKDIKQSGGSGATEKSFHIDFLKTKFRDLSRPNQFKVKIKPPSILQKEWSQEINVLVKSASFPSIEIDEYAIERAGLVLHIPTNKINYGELSITFWNDVDFRIRTLFNRWQRLTVFNWQQDIGSIPLLAMDGEITVYQFDSNHKEVYAIKVDNCWPKTISEIALSHDNDSQVSEFSVSFPYTNQYIYNSKQ